MDSGLRRLERNFQETPTLNNLLHLWKAQQRQGVPVELILALQVTWPVGHQISFRKEVDTQFSIDGLLLDSRTFIRIYTNIQTALHMQAVFTDLKLHRWFWKPSKTPYRYHKFIIFGVLPDSQEFIKAEVPFHVSKYDNYSFLMLAHGTPQDSRLAPLPLASWETLNLDQLGVGPDSDLTEVSAPEGAFELPMLDNLLEY